MQATSAIMVLGSSGMLGSTVHRVLSAAGWHVDGSQASDPAAPDYLDILAMPRTEWTTHLQRRRYGYIVNCVGILKSAVKEQEARTVERAIRVNALFPHELAALLSDTRILHISTDGVFAGTQDRPYLETDPTDCPDAYGKTKALGECAAQNVLNFRCSIIGRDVSGGKGLVEWVLSVPEGSELTGFEDHLWNGVTTNQFADLCRRIIESDAFERLRGVSNTHHFCPNPPVSKYDLLSRLCAAAGRNLTIRRGQSGAPSRRILGTVYSAVRELYSACNNWDPLLETAIRPLT